MLQGERRPRDDEADRTDGKGNPVAQDDAEGGRNRRDPPDRKEHALFPVTLVERHKHTERDPREREKEQQETGDYKKKSQQKIHPLILPDAARVSQP